MSIRFKHNSQTLAETIKNASNTNATYVIPDLQRPFVWTPMQVIMLIDSIFKGWPFGTLLLWEVKPDCFTIDEGIPNRPFWQIVDKTKEDQGTQTSILGQPATYFMVLDGQQRIQSLVLALGGDTFGFKLYDSEWALTMQDRRAKPSEHWSSAVLCVDLNRFSEELISKENKVRKIEVGKILDWVIIDNINGLSSSKRQANYEYPLLNTKDNPGRFIRLSRFWDLAQTSLTEDEYEEILKPFLNEHNIEEDTINELIRPLAQFMHVIEIAKNNCLVHSLQIESFKLTPQWSKDDYSDAIVNIFTRLNTAGRTLTREEITLAWLKVGWEKTLTKGKPASECLEELKDILEDKGFKIEMDEIVRLISFIWAVDERSGLLLDSKDLLKGDIIKPMARAVSSNWDNLMLNLENGVETIKERNLIRVMGSFNAVIVFLTWHRIIYNQFSKIRNELLVPEQDSFEKQLNEIVHSFLDRWIFGSQWANVWGEAAVLNFSNFAKDLSEIKISVTASNRNSYIGVLDKSVEKLMGRIATKAIDYVNNTVVRNRTRVSSYYTLLWIWHRLEENRWKMSSIQLREGRKRNTPLDVDHTIADAYWKRIINDIIESKLLTFTGTDEERALIGPDEFPSKKEAIEFINLLGNCSLLEKSFNISKSDKTMKSFLNEVHDFKDGKCQIDDWEVALSLDKVMTDPTGVDLKILNDAIRQRDILIRSNLTDFINGSKYRVD